MEFLRSFLSLSIHWIFCFLNLSNRNPFVHFATQYFVLARFSSVKFNSLRFISFSFIYLLLLPTQTNQQIDNIYPFSFVFVIIWFICLFDTNTHSYMLAHINKWLYINMHTVRNKSLDTVIEIYAEKHYVRLLRKI